MVLTIRTDWERPARPPDGIVESILCVGVIPDSNLKELNGDYCVLLDCSASMAGDKMKTARTACQVAFGCLRGTDSVSIIGFSTDTVSVIEKSPMQDIKTSDLERELMKLTASGVTRTDLALSKAEEILSTKKTKGANQAILLITDGDPTDTRGRMLKDYNSLYQQAHSLGAEGISLITIGLGNAENYNTSFLQKTADQGKGKFCYSSDPQELERILKEQIRSLASVVASDVSFIIKARRKGTEVTEACRIDPGFLPLEFSPLSEGEWACHCGSLSAAGTESLFLFKIETPGRFGLSSDSYPVLDISVSLRGQGGHEQKTGPHAVSLTYTTVLKEQQQVNKQVRPLRYQWDMNIYNMELQNSKDHHRTGDLLQKIADTAKATGDMTVATQAMKEHDRLKKTGKLSRHNLTETSQLIRTGHSPSKDGE